MKWPLSVVLFASLYVASEMATPLRPTEDIDCVIEISSRIAYSELEKKLRNLGLKHDMTSKLICRWEVSGIKIDVMPIDPKILGFTNRWYSSGFQYREKCVLPSGTGIYIFPLAYFIASKFEALQNRGGHDWRLAHDLEDILLVLDGCNKPLRDFSISLPEVKEFLSNAATRLLKLPNLEEILHAHLAREEETSINRVRQILIEMSGIWR